MPQALFHSGDFPRSRSRTQPYIPGLLFKSRNENIGRALELVIQIPQWQPSERSPA